MSFTLPLEITPFFEKTDATVVKNLLITTEGIFAGKSTNLNVVKDELGNILQNQETTKPSSNYKRLIRFFKINDEEKKELVKSLLCSRFLHFRLKRNKAKIFSLRWNELGIRNKKDPFTDLEHSDKWGEYSDMLGGFR